jgi:archaeal flagellar protein FlaJ
MKFEKKNFVGLILGLLIVVVAFIFLRGDNMFWFLTVLAAIISALPFLVMLLLSQGRQKEKESRFLEFTRDLVENVKSGTPVSKSILNLQKREYGALTPHVQKLGNQISLGITLTNALRTFAKETKSKVISRAVGLISEAERAGGKIETILESVARSVNQIEDLKKERKSAISNLVVQGYIIFIVFIIIMLVLEFKILPLTAGLADVEGLSISVSNVDPSTFAAPLFIMILVQSFFAGLVIGKIAEGSLMNGIKHSFILLALTLLITTGAKALLG